MKNLKKILVAFIVILFIVSINSPVFNAQNLKVSSINSENKILVSSYLKNRFNKQKIQSEISSDELQKLRETLDKTYFAIQIINSKDSSENQKTDAYNTLRNTYFQLKQLKLLDEKIDEKEFISLTTGNNIISADLLYKINNLKSRFTSNKDINLTEGIALVGRGSNVRTSFYYNAFIPFIAFLGNYVAEPIWGMPGYLAKAFFAYLLMWVPMMRGMMGVMNVFSNIWQEHKITGYFGDSSTGRLNSSNFSKSFFVFSMGLWIELPVDYCNKFPYYESEWFFAGMAAWVGRK